MPASAPPLTNRLGRVRLCSSPQQAFWPWDESPSKLFFKPAIWDEPIKGQTQEGPQALRLRAFWEYQSDVLTIDVVERLHASILAGIAQLLFDAKKLVVLGNTVRTARSAGLDLASVGCNREVGNGNVFGFAGTMGHNACITCLLCHLNSLKGLGEGTDLVNLYQDCVSATKLDALGKALGVGYEQVVANQLNLVANAVGETSSRPSLPWPCRLQWR